LKKKQQKKSRTTKQKRQPTHPNEFSDSNQLVMIFSRNSPVLGVHKRQLLKSQYQQPKSGFILKTPKMWCAFMGLQELAKRLAHVSSLVVSQHLGRCWYPGIPL